MSENLVVNVPGGSDAGRADAGAFVVKLWPVLLGLVFVVGGILLEAYPHDKMILGIPYAEAGLISLICKELGVAFLIAFIIAILIEKKASEERDRLFRTYMISVQKNVLEAVYAKRIPNEYFKYIETHLFQNDFYRSDLSVNYLIALKESGVVEITSTTTYDVTNTSYDRATSTVGAHFEKSFQSNLPVAVKLKRLCVKKRSATAPLLDLKEADVADAIRRKIVTLEDTVETIKYGHSFEMMSGETCSVAIENTWVADKDHYDFWRTAVPADGIRYQVIGQDLDIRVVPIHPVEPQRVVGSPGDAMQGWEITAPLVPDQGFLVWWSPKREPDKTP